MSTLHLPALAHWLPYWTWRDVPVGGGLVSVLVLVDGTLVVGFESTGADVFSSDNAQLNRNAASLRRALNVLPANAFIQTEWHTGLGYAEMIRAYEGRGRAQTERDELEGHDVRSVLVEQRRCRAQALKKDPTLRRGRLLVFVGQRQALGRLSPHGRGDSASALSGLFGRLLGAKGPQSIDAPSFVTAVTRLWEVASRVRDELAATGSVLTPLLGPELLGELHRALNPTTSKNIPVVVSDVALELAAELVNRPPYAVHRPLSLREQLPLGDLAWSEEHFTLDDPPTLSRCLSLQRLPAFTKPDLMMGVQFATGATFRLVSTFVATDKEALTERLIRKRNIAHAQAVGIVRDVAADVAFSEYERVLEKMLTEDQRVFSASVTAVIHAATHEALDLGTRELKDAFGDAGAVLTTETGRQLPSYLGALPGNGFAAPRQHQVITNNAADLLPYFVPSFGDDEPQLIYHTRQGTLRRLSLAPSKKRANNNALVFGSSGSGKSFNVACIFEQACLAEGAPLMVVDVQGPELSSYRALAELFGGSYTALASDEDAAFSPFVPYDELFGGTGTKGQPEGAHADEEALSFMSSLVALMALPEIETRRERPFAREIARAVILRAYQTAHAAAGGDKCGPLLGDVVQALSRYVPEHEEHRAVAREMFLQLQTWVTDPVRARLLNRRGKLAQGSAGSPGGPLGAANRRQTPMQVFDFFGMERDQELATVLLLSVSFSIWQHLKRYPRDVQKLVVFDECWKLLTSKTASELVAELFRTGRKWGASTWAITQNLADFQSSPVHAAVLNNAAMTFLMQHAGDHDAVSALCGLNDREAALFRQLKMRKGEFSEMLFVERGAAGSSGERASILRLVPTACDLWLNTTDPADVGFRDRIIKDRGLSLVEAIRFCAERYPNGAPRRDERREERREQRREERRRERNGERT